MGWEQDFSAKDTALAKHLSHIEKGTRLEGVFWKRFVHAIRHALRAACQHDFLPAKEVFPAFLWICIQVGVCFLGWALTGQSSPWVNFFFFCSGFVGNLLSACSFLSQFSVTSGVVYQIWLKLARIGFVNCKLDYSSLTICLQYLEFMPFNLAWDFLSFLLCLA